MRFFLIEDKYEGATTTAAWIGCGYLRGGWKGKNVKHGIYASFIVPLKWFSQWDDFDSGDIVDGYRRKRFSIWFRRNPEKWRIRFYHYNHVISQKTVMAWEEREEKEKMRVLL